MLILASASQSRKKLLENCQIEFIQISSDFDETTIQEKNIFNLALELSFQKANSLSENIPTTLFPKEFNYGPLEILGCDSIFEFKGEAYGKPSGNKKGKQSNFAKLSIFQPNKYKFKKTCPLSVKGAPEVDYKNIKLLKKYVSENGKILPSRITNV